MKEKENKGLKFGICDVLFIVFVVLKLTGVVTWSWWIVTLPITIPVGSILFLSMMIGLFDVIDKLNKDRQ